MNARTVKSWNPATGKDTVLNATLLGAALVVVIYGLIAGSVDSPTPPHQATAAVASARHIA